MLNWAGPGKSLSANELPAIPADVSRKWFAEALKWSPWFSAPNTVWASSWSREQTGVVGSMSAGLFYEICAASGH